MPIVWVCMECGREQPDQELQCVCGNIDALMFIEKGLHSAVDAPVRSMVEETPVEEITTLEDDVPVIDTADTEPEKAGELKVLESDETPTPVPDPEPEPKSTRGIMRRRTSR